jgi:hypothetical protein
MPDNEKPKNKRTGVTLSGNVLKTFAEKIGTTKYVPQAPVKTYKQFGAEGGSVADAKRYNLEKHGTTEPSKEGKINAKKVETPGALEINDIPKPATPATPGDKVDTFTPESRRRSNRSEKVALRQERQMGRKSARKIGKAIKQGLVSPDEKMASGMTYGQGLKQAKKDKAGLGQVGTDRFANPSRYKSMTQGTVHNPDRTKKVEFDKNPSKGKPGKPGSNKTVLNKSQMEAVKKRSDYTSMDDLTGKKKVTPKNKFRGGF